MPAGTGKKISETNLPGSRTPEDELIQDASRLIFMSCNGSYLMNIPIFSQHFKGKSPVPLRIMTYDAITQDTFEEMETSYTRGGVQVHSIGKFKSNTNIGLSQ